MLETCMYFPFITGEEHDRLRDAAQSAHAGVPAAADDPGARVRSGDAEEPRDGERRWPPGRALHVHRPRPSTRMVRAHAPRRGSSSRRAPCACTRPSADPPLIERRDAARIDALIDARHFQPGRISVSAAHLMGGCAMGQPHSAVTDSYGRVHGVPWLRVADASLFPDALEINPYLTIMALADRVAEGIRGTRAPTDGWDAGAACPANELRGRLGSRSFQCPSHHRVAAPSDNHDQILIYRRRQPGAPCGVFPASGPSGS